VGGYMRNTTDIYRKIFRIAESLYNRGLEQAKQRDLSGAMRTLKQALKYNKKQIQARNLLGLVYYEMGELGWAQYHWNISTQYQPEDNPAERYLKEICTKADVTDKRLAIEKYNQALYSAQTGSLDMAFLQAKKAVDLNPNMVKAQCLLALLCIQEQKESRGYRAIKDAQKVDTGNILIARYSQNLHVNNSVIRQAKKEEKSDKKEKEDVIIPTYSESSGLVQSFFQVVAGLVLGLLVAWFLIFPTAKQSLVAENNDKIRSYAADLSAKEAEIKDLNDDITTLTKAKKKAEKSLKAYTGKNGVIAAYDSLLICIQSYMEDDYLQAINSYSDIDSETISDDTFQEVYKKLKSEFDENGRDILYSQATTLYQRGDYTEAIEYYKACLELQSDDPQAMYWMALSYHNSGDKETADIYYDKLIKEYGDTRYGQQSQIYRKYS
jgi:tetratricopeptide (TPR) repeat protein